MHIKKIEKNNFTVDPDFIRDPKTGRHQFSSNLKYVKNWSFRTNSPLYIPRPIPITYEVIW